MKKNDWEWTKLDNAAKIFPAASTKVDTKVFRFSCELNAMVQEELLQDAVEIALEDFPLYRSILKRGLFWYYLEHSDLQPVVKEEDHPPCSPIYDRNRKNLLFEVTYYRTRINLEVYHVLSDGAGAMEFLRDVVYRYLSLCYPEKLQNVQLDYDASYFQKEDDSFRKYYGKKKGKRKKEKVAYKIRGLRMPEGRMKVIEGIMPVGQTIGKAKEYGVTLTVFLCAALLCAIEEEMATRAKKRPVVVTVPVNLRQFFYSQSSRNFFSIINIGYDFGRDSDRFSDVVEEVARKMRLALMPERLEERLNSLGAIEHNVFARIAPLFFKDICLRIAHDVSAMENTVALSNIGKVNMPQPMEEYISLFDVMVSTKKVQICMCSFQDKLSITFTSGFVSTEIQKHFFRRLSSLGIPIEIRSNPE